MTTSPQPDLLSRLLRAAERAALATDAFYKGDGPEARMLRRGKEADALEAELRIEMAALKEAAQ